MVADYGCRQQDPQKRRGSNAVSSCGCSTRDDHRRVVFDPQDFAATNNMGKSQIFEIIESVGMGTEDVDAKDRKTGGSTFNAIQARLRSKAKLGSDSCSENILSLGVPVNLIAWK